MRLRWLFLTLPLLACSDPVEPPIVVVPQCEVGFQTLNVPHAISEVVASTATFEDIRLTCYQNATTGRVEYRYRITLATEPSTEVQPWTQWDDGDMPTIRVQRHATYRTVLIWDVRVGEALSTSLRFIEP